MFNSESYDIICLGRGWKMEQKKHLKSSGQVISCLNKINELSKYVDKRVNTRIRVDLLYCVGSTLLV